MLSIINGRDVLPNGTVAKMCALSERGQFKLCLSVGVAICNRTIIRMYMNYYCSSYGGWRNPVIRAMFTVTRCLFELHIYILCFVLLVEYFDR